MVQRTLQVGISKLEKYWMQSHLKTQKLKENKNIQNTIQYNFNHLNEEDKNDSKKN